ncbi:MAG: bifunctional oligoribonuclease/PAP phosphatase NrnA [Candidatus Falkowbacteria bacterium]|nr:bifunctional oligoribonuclease/PAP phosphatase NrnA [Candidatus Falkowbacteria bacterium]
MDIQKNFQDAYQAILKANKILLVGHVNPDGDDLASICLLMELLKNKHKKYLAYCEGWSAGQWLFLPQQADLIGSKTELIARISSREILDSSTSDSPTLNSPIDNSISGDRKRENYLDYFDLIITLDCGSLNRTNLATEISQRQTARVIEFDHHLKVDDYADIELRLSDKASTTEVLYNFLVTNKITITKNIATCILTGILTDTSNFLYPNASQETIHIASEMLNLGVSFNKIINETLSNKNLITVKFLSRALDNLQINQQKQIAVSVLQPRDFDEIGREFAPETFDDIVAFLGNLAGVKAVLFMREYESGKIKGSWRSRPNGYDVNEFAKALGGGGHKCGE